MSQPESKCQLGTQIVKRPRAADANAQVTVVGDLHGQLFDFDHMLGLAGARLSLLGSWGLGFRCRSCPAPFMLDVRKASREDSLRRTTRAFAA